MTQTAQKFPLWRERETLPRRSLRYDRHLYSSPYCRTKCNYCAFVSAAPRNERSWINIWRLSLIHIREQAPFFTEREFSTLFLGGGTPSLMGAGRLSKVLSTVKSFYRLAPDAEITLEANPESAHQDLFEALILSD